MRHEPLVERFERLRFRALWHLPVDQAELERLEAEVLVSHGRHPLVLNHAARLALPETDLPAPPRGLSGVAAAFLSGDLDSARALLKQHGGPRISVVRGDLALAEGQHTEAKEHFEAAKALFGAHPPLIARLARCLMRTNQATTARKLLFESLSINPLHGNSRALLQLAVQEAGQTALQVPLHAPVRVSEAGLETAVDMSANHREIWRAWYRAQLREVPEQPKAASHSAMLELWRRQPRSPGPTDALCEQLDSWEQDGLLEAYQWTTSLKPENAPSFRVWVDANPSTLFRFWAQTIRKSS